MNMNDWWEVNKIRNKIYAGIKAKRFSESVKDLVGCDYLFFHSYIKSKLKEGMTFQNYGRNGWVIDHIKPIRAFNLNNPAELKMAFNYRNTQPLLVEENQKKSDKINGRSVRYK